LATPWGDVVVDPAASKEEHLFLAFLAFLQGLTLASSILLATLPGKGTRAAERPSCKQVSRIGLLRREAIRIGDVDT